MKDKIQRKRMNFECNKNRGFSLKKIKLIIQTTYQMINTMSSFDSKWSHNHSKDLFNLNKRKEKALSFEKWNQQILFNILQDIKNMILQNKTKKRLKRKKNDQKSFTFEDEASKSYDESKKWFISIVNRRDIMSMNVQSRNKWKRQIFISSQFRSYCQSKRKGNDYAYTLFLYIYILLFILIHSTFYTHTPLRIKLARRHARCTRNKLAVLQHNNFMKLLNWSSAFDICKHDSNRAIFDVDYHVWNESFLKSWDFDVLRRRTLRK
jgi:hypothetical protein